MMPKQGLCVDRVQNRECFILTKLYRSEVAAKAAQSKQGGRRYPEQLARQELADARLNDRSLYPNDFIRRRAGWSLSREKIDTSQFFSDLRISCPRAGRSSPSRRANTCIGTLNPPLTPPRRGTDRRGMGRLRLTRSDSILSDRRDRPCSTSKRLFRFL